MKEKVGSAFIVVPMETISSFRIGYFDLQALALSLAVWCVVLVSLGQVDGGSL